MVALLSLALAAELERVPATRTVSLNGVESTLPAEGWMVVDEAGRRIGPAEFALTVGDHETTALLAVVQTRRDRRGVALMVLGGASAVGGVASFAAGSALSSAPLTRGGLVTGLGGFVALSLGRRLTRTLHPDINELDEIYTAEEVDAWIASLEGP